MLEKYRTLKAVMYSPTTVAMEHVMKNLLHSFFLGSMTDLARLSDHGVSKGKTLASELKNLCEASILI